MNDMVSLVAQTPLGVELSESETEILSGLMHFRDLSDGEFLFEEGSKNDSLHVLLTGRLEVVKKAGGDEIAHLAILRQNDLAGELSFIDGHEHTVGLSALGECTILSLSRHDFEAIVDDHPQLTYKVMRAIARSSHRIVHRMNFEFIELNNYIFQQHGRY